MIPPLQPTTGFADVNGAHLYYEVAGSGPPLVLLHARIADSRMWDANWQLLTEQYTVLRYDLRGHGKSVMPAGPFSHVADLAELLRVLHIEQVSLIGVSMGGEIAIDFTLEHPSNVAALIPVSCAPSGYQGSPDLEPRWAAIFTALEQGDFAGAVELELQLWVDGPRRTPNQVNPIVRERVREMDTAYWLALAEYRGQAQPLPPMVPPASTRLDTISAPTLIVVGDADIPDMLASAELLATAIPTAEKMVVPNAGHMLTMEQPEVFNQTVHQFLTRQA